MYNQDQYYINLGKKATISGLVGFLFGIVFALLVSFPVIAVFITAFIFAYLFTSSYWGIHKLKMWFKKYRYQMPIYIWHFLSIFVYFFAIIISVIGYGFIEHFLLLLAIEQQDKGPGFIGAQIILLPYLGELYAKKINYRI